MKGEEILKEIKELNRSVDKIENLTLQSVETLAVQKVPEIPKPPESKRRHLKEMQAEYRKNIREFWTDQLSAYPSEPQVGKLIYIDNKEELFEKLVSSQDNLLGALDRIVALKTSLRVNSKEVKKGEEITVDVLSDRETGGYRILVFRTKFIPVKGNKLPILQP